MIVILSMAGVVMFIMAMLMNAYRLIMERMMFKSLDPFCTIEMILKFCVFTIALLIIFLKAAGASEYKDFTALDGSKCQIPEVLCRPIPSGDIGFRNGAFYWFNNEIPVFRTVPGNDSRYHLCEHPNHGIQCLIVPTQ